MANIPTTRKRSTKTRPIVFTTLDDLGLNCQGLVHLWVESWQKHGWAPRIWPTLVATATSSRLAKARRVSVSVINRGFRPGDRWRKPTEFGTGKWRRAKLVNFSVRWQHPAFDQVTAIRNAYGSRS